MTDTVQIVAIGVSLALLAVVLELVRRRRLAEEYSIIWIAVGLGLLVLAIRPALLTTAAHAVGIYYPPALLILVLVFFVFVVSLYFSLVISRQRHQIEQLVEDIALLEADLRDLRSSTRSGRPEQVEGRTSAGSGLGSVPPEQVMPGAAGDRGQPGNQRRVG